MPAPAFARRPARTARALGTALLLTLALGRVTGGGADAAGAAPPLPTDAAGARPAAAPPPAITAAVGPRPVSVPAAAAHPVPVADPPPFAPGGDDLLHYDPPAVPTAPSARPRAETGTTAPAHETARSAAALPAQAFHEDRGDDWIAGDFFGDGRRALFRWTRGTGGHARAAFVALDRQGRWRDHSASLLDDADRALPCRQPGRPVLADFNGDGRPDVLLPCAAADGPCHPMLLLSQPDGRYQRRVLAQVAQSAEAEAADFDGDGLTDIATVDTTAGAWRPLWWRGRGDGSFGDQ